MKLIITVLVLSLVIQIESLYASRHFMGRDQRKSIGIDFINFFVSIIFIQICFICLQILFYNFLFI